MNKFLIKLKDFYLSFTGNLTLKHKIVIMLVGALAVLFIIIGYTLNNRIVENSIKTVENSLRNELILRDKAILYAEQSIQGKIKTLSNANGLYYEDEYEYEEKTENVNRVLREFARDNEEFSQVLFATKGGKFTEVPKTAREKEFDPRKTVWYKDATDKAAKNSVIITAPFQGLDKNAKMGFYFVANHEGAPFGVVGATIDFSKLVKMSGDAENLIVLDSEGNIVFDEKNSENLFNKLDSVDLGDLSLLGQKNDGIGKISLKGKNMLAVFYKSDATNLKYIKLIDYDAAMTVARDAKYTLIISFLIVLIICCALCKLLYKGIEKSFKNIEAQTEAIIEWKLDDVLDVKETSDEVGRLSFAFGEMAKSIKTRIAYTETESQNLRARLKDAGEKIETIKESSKNTNEHLNALSSASENKLTNIQNAAKEIECLENDLAEFSDLQTKNKNDIITLVENAEKLVARLKDEQETAESKFNREKEENENDFKEKAKNLEDALKKTAESASEIGLMAFSAALEAAKGNDKKSEFEKVAEDIRKLADTLSKSASNGLTAIENLSPKVIEKSVAISTAELSDIIAMAKNIDDNFSAAENVAHRLETAEKNAKTAAKETVLLEEKSNTTLKDALTSAEETANNIEEAETIIKKAFE